MPSQPFAVHRLPKGGRVLQMDAQQGGAGPHRAATVRGDICAISGRQMPVLLYPQGLHTEYIERQWLLKVSSSSCLRQEACSLSMWCSAGGSGEDGPSSQKDHMARAVCAGMARRAEHAERHCAGLVPSVKP